MANDPPVLEYGTGRNLAPTVNWKRVGVISAILAIASVIYLPFSPRARQARNLSKVQSQIPIVAAKISQDSRFPYVYVDTWYQGNGSLGVFGGVPSKADLDALKSLVASTSPQVEVTWHVEVMADEELETYFDGRISNGKYAPRQSP